MTKRVRHIWAKANQHIKVHRRGTWPGNGKNDNTNTIIIIVVIVVFIWVCS